MGDRVIVVGGPHRGKVGTVTQVFASTGRYLVQLDEVRQPVTLEPRNIRLAA